VQEFAEEERHFLQAGFRAETRLNFSNPINRKQNVLSLKESLLSSVSVSCDNKCVRHIMCIDITMLLVLVALWLSTAFASQATVMCGAAAGLTNRESLSGWT
jgi:hypothetical protein